MTTHLQEPGIGTTIGEFTITGVLGHGSMAVVYKAKDRAGHEVALKLFREGSGVSHTMLERFRRETEATKKLRRHPYILTVYTSGQEGPFHYIAMEFIAGKLTLEGLMQEPMKVPDLLRIATKITSAIDYAHENHIVHRDIKPANIMVDEFGDPLLADFGVAELVDWPSCTTSGALTGTPSYMSPEQARAERVGPASDIYSLGVVMFEALTGRLPYEFSSAPSSAEVLEGVKTLAPIKPRKLRAISPDLEYVLLKCLAKDPRDRYAGAKALLHDLDCVLEGRAVSARHFHLGFGLKHFLRKHKAALNIGIIVGMIGSIATIIALSTLRSMHNQQLLNLARLRSAELDLHLVTLETEKLTGGSRADQEVRLGRQEMQSGDYDSARTHFQAAAAISTLFKDRRSASLSRLEQARCEVLLQNGLRAKELYLEILSNPDASAAIKTIAHAEFVMILMLTGAHDEAVEMAHRFSTQEEGPYHDIILCLIGELNQEVFSERIARFPERFRNDAFLALAVLARKEGRTEESNTYRNRSLKASNPRYEWPAPLARLMPRVGQS